MPVCRIGGCKIAIVKDRIVDASIEACIGNAKKVLIGALSNGVGNSHNNVNNPGTLFVS